MMRIDAARLALLLGLIVGSGCAQEQKSTPPARVAQSTAAPQPEAAPAMAESPPAAIQAQPAPPTPSVTVERSMAPPTRAIAPQHPVRATGADTSHSTTAGSVPPVVPESTPVIEPRPHFATVADATAGTNAVVEVFYGTDRRGVDRAKLTTLDYLRQFRIAAVIALLVAVTGLVYQQRFQARAPAWLTLSGAVVIAVALAFAGLGTLRMTDEARQIGRVYGNQRGELEWGKCQVSIPHHHQPGALETPSVVKFEFREDPDRHVILQSVVRLDQPEFYQQLIRANQASRSQDLFVFVHGFNVTFSDAARRTAQLSYDLPYTGTPVLFTWPSQGRPDLIAYTTDGTTADWAATDLENFLDGLLVEFGPERLNLVAHSMGNRVLTAAVRQLALKGRIQGKLREIVLAAPDVDASLFRRDLAQLLAKSASRVTLYASSTDEALKVSRGVNGAPRVGDTAEVLMLAPGIDTIDVSEVDSSLLGHTYYGSNVNVLADLFYLMTRNLPAEQRSWLDPRDRDGMRYWILKRRALEDSVANRTGEISR
ncbi:MAG: alpha/beta fold hydrolase [Planctomycetaceae bacterium]|nr:alpha/beta fold hydrolase [Planctomycetaceae bacterium]